jgi:hypothetical protein
MDRRIRPFAKKEAADLLHTKVLQDSSTQLQPSSGLVPGDAHETLATQGQALDKGTRAFMEPRFGHDFSQVRIHDDARAAESARTVDALAYTVGQDIVFGQGQYRPETANGQYLLAHELTHTLQQGVVQADSAAGLGDVQINTPGDKYEQEANRVVTGVLTSPDGSAGLDEQGQPTLQGSTENIGTPLLQRQDSSTFNPIQQQPVNPLDPKVMSQAASEVLEAERKPVQTWLDSNTTRLNIIPKEQIMIQIRQNVPEAAKLADAEIRSLIDEWAHRNHIALPDIHSVPQGEVATAALGALSLANDGVTIISSPAEVKISITGATATLKAGDVDIEANLGIDRSIELSATYGNFKFSAQMSGQKWSLTLSYGTEDVPDLGGLANTFKQGEQSLRKVAGDPASLRNPEIASNVKEALDSLGSIVKSIPKRIEISVGSADSSSGGSGASAVPQGGWQVMVKITVLKF